MTPLTERKQCRQRDFFFDEGMVRGNYFGISLLLGLTPKTDTCFSTAIFEIRAHRSGSATVSTVCWQTARLFTSNHHHGYVCDPTNAAHRHICDSTNMVRRCVVVQQTTSEYKSSHTNMMRCICSYPSAKLTQRLPGVSIFNIYHACAIYLPQQQQHQWYHC